MRRLPVTLWRHILGDLWRLLLITTGVLVVVISFAATVKPLADGKLMPLDALRFMVYAMPPMLAYALPFAACFASTLVYHRLATDNEAQAASAGGISHRALLMPAVITGVTLAGALAALNEQIIPRFLRGMQEMITADVTRMLGNAVQRGEGIELGGRWVYADEKVDVPPEPGSPVVSRMVLLRVVLLELDGDGRVRTEGTAEKAFVVLHRAEDPRGENPRGVLRLSIAPRNVVGRRSDGTLITNEVPMTVTVDVPDAFEDDPKFLTFGELRRLRDRPEGMNWIEQHRRGLAVEIARARAVDDLARMIREGGEARLRDADGRSVVVRASGLGKADGGRGYVIVPGASGVEVVRWSPGREREGDRFVARAARLIPADVPPGPEASVEFRIELERPTAFAGGDAVGGTRDQFTLGGLWPEVDPLVRLSGLGIDALLSEVDLLPKQIETDLAPVRSAASGLRDRVEKLGREVVSKQHERAALAASCAVMVLTGALTALRLSLRQPLTVYLWCFFPALISVVTIAGGQQMTHGSGDQGLILLWGGVGALALFTLWTFRRVARH